MAKRFSKKSLLGYALFMAFYLPWIVYFVGFRVDHLFFILIISVLYFAFNITHRITVGMIFFIVFWVLYDGMRVIPNYEVNPVHIQDLFEFEKKWFGFMSDGVRITPNEYFLTYNNTFLDIIAGCFYILWMPAPLLFSVVMFYKDQDTLIKFSAIFLLTNLIGFTIYYLYPAAPPWYVNLYGFEQYFNLSGNPGSLSKFDDLIGFPIYESMYNKNSNVFAAVPSMHSAFPFLLLYFGIKKRSRILISLFTILTLGIWFTAVYSQHHYVIDVILGVICAIFAILIFEKAILKTRTGNQLAKISDYIQSPR